MKLKLISGGEKQVRIGGGLYGLAIDKVELDRADVCHMAREVREGNLDRLAGWLEHLDMRMYVPSDDVTSGKPS